MLPITKNENAFVCIQGITQKLNLCKTPEHEKNEILQMLYAFEKYLRNEFADKLHRRNLQIKELKKVYQRRLVICDNIRQNITFLEKFIEENKLEVPHFEGVTNFDFALRDL